jgi:hypothetical protein
MSRSRSRRRARDVQSRCTFCEVGSPIERHHVGLRNHAPDFTLPLCQSHHRELSKRIQASGIEMRHTTNRVHRIAHALKAVAVFLYQLGEELLK